jgi:uncharacterized protein YndB with AHSA1/START domain
MAESFEVRRILPATPDRVFRAWLDAQEHSAMTGGAYRDLDGGSFTAWAGYIQGRTLEKDEGRRIVQLWRTTEFPPEAPDSRLELILAPADSGTEILLRHTELPDGQGDAYRSGWEEHYFDPMEEYFGMAVSRQVDALEDEESAAAAPAASGDADDEGGDDEGAMIVSVIRQNDGPAAQPPKRARPAAAKKAAPKKAAKKAAPKKPAKKAGPKKSAKKAAPKKSAKSATSRKAPKKPAAKKGGKSSAPKRKSRR